jgi:hypothetical protein
MKVAETVRLKVGECPPPIFKAEGGYGSGGMDGSSAISEAGVAERS